MAVTRGRGALRGEEILTAENRAIVFRYAGEDRCEGGGLMATPPVREIDSAIPGLAPERPVIWPQRMRVTLPNGLEVVLVGIAHDPEIHTESCFFEAGMPWWPHRSPGLAEMTATVARTGTSKRTSRQIEEDLRRMGADLGTSAGQTPAPFRSPD